jgi:hypothetical protein
MATQSISALASYRDAITQLVKAGEFFGDIEEAIDGATDLTRDEKAALWLLAFSHRDQAAQQRDAHAHLAALQAG